MGTEAEADVGLEIESDKAVLSLRSDFLPQMTALHFGPSLWDASKIALVT